MLPDRRTHEGLKALELRSQFRRRAGLTLFALAQRVGKSAGTLSQWERGQINLPNPDVERIARALREELAKFPASLSVTQIVALLSEAVSSNLEATHES
jgi:transcriptional regulator with XRE-family HTH domain